MPIITNGGSRRAGGWWAQHLENGEKNETVRLAEVVGLSGTTATELFREMYAMSRGSESKATNYFYQANINPRDDEHLTPQQRHEAKETLLKNLGLEGQPHFVYEHEKKGRLHIHVVAFRIDLETQRAIPDSLTAVIHEKTSRELEIKFDLERGKSILVKDRDFDRPDRRPKKYESFRSMDSGIDPEIVKADARQHWQRSDNGASFKAALEASGDYVLARGDRRDFVIIDRAGDDHSLGRRLGVKAAEMRARMSDLDPANLPSVEQAQEIQRARTAERDHAAGIDRAAHAAMQAAHAEARGKYDSLRETERKVSRDQFPGRYDDLRAAEPPPEVVREFDANANRAAEPAAPIYDRDQDNAAWEAKLAENAINAEAQKGHRQPGDSAGNETRRGGAEPSGGAQQRPEPEDMRPLGKVAGEIRTAWNLTRNAKEDLRRDDDELETALAARGISLAEVSAEEAQQSQRTAAFAKEVGNFARVLREGEIVAIDQYGAVHRFDQRTTGDLRPEIEARFAGIDRASLMNVTDTKEAMQQASRETWRAERQAEREQARPASWIEQRIAECADVARKEGATIQQDRDGHRVGGIEALTDSLRPEGARETKEVKVYGAEAFAALLEDAGIAIARVTEPDTRVLDSWREQLTKDRMLSEAVDDIHQGTRIDALVMGDLAAVTRKGDVYRINPEKLGDAQRHIGDDLPGVIETQAKFKVERAATADIWAELKAANAEDRAARNAAFEGDRALHRNAAAAERGVENTLGTADDAVNAGLHAASGFGTKLAKFVENALGGILSFFGGGGEPKLTPMQMHDRARAESNEETLHARGYADHVRQTEAERDERIFNQDRQQQQEEQSFAARYGTPGNKSAGRAREEDYDRGRERER